MLLLSRTAHNKGVAAIRYFPKSAHLLLSAGMDCKVKVREDHMITKCCVCEDHMITNVVFVRITCSLVCVCACVIINIIVLRQMYISHSKVLLLK